MRALICLILILILPSLYAEPLIVGIRGYNPPFAVKADEKNHFFGFEIDIMSDICKRIQATCTYRALKFTEVFAELLSKHINVAITSISITDERRKDFLFSMPYLDSSIRYVSMINSKFKELDDLKNQRIGCERNTLCKRITLAHISSNVKIIEFDTLPEIFKALVDGSVDAVMADDKIAKYWVAASNNVFRLVGQNIPIGYGYGIVANKDNEALIKRINKALQDMGNDGTYQIIYSHYF